MTTRLGARRLRLAAAGFLGAMLLSSAIPESVGIRIWGAPAEEREPARPLSLDFDPWANVAYAPRPEAERWDAIGNRTWDRGNELPRLGLVSDLPPQPDLRRLLASVGSGGASGGTVPRTRDERSRAPVDWLSVDWPGLVVFPSKGGGDKGEETPVADPVAGESAEAVEPGEEEETLVAEATAAEAGDQVVEASPRDLIGEPGPAAVPVHDIATPALGPDVARGGTPRDTADRAPFAGSRETPVFRFARLGGRSGADSKESARPGSEQAEAPFRSAPRGEPGAPAKRSPSGPTERDGRDAVEPGGLADGSPDTPRAGPVATLPAPAAGALPVEQGNPPGEGATDAGGRPVSSPAPARVPAADRPSPGKPAASPAVPATPAQSSPDRPSTSRPSKAQPSTTRPSTAQPSTAQPSLGKPETGGAGDRVAGDPAPASPARGKPSPAGAGEPPAGAGPKEERPIVLAEAADQPSVLKGNKPHTQKDLEDVDVLAPGNSPGWTRFVGDVALDGTVLEIELGGTTFDFATSVFEYDRLIVEDGTALLNGPISVLLYDAFAPLLGDVFDIVEATAIDLTDAEFFFPLLSDGLAFAYQILGVPSGDEVLRLSIVESPTFTMGVITESLRVSEPGSLLLLLGGLLGLGLLRRRRGAGAP